jgi:hypothetical protein
MKKLCSSRVVLFGVLLLTSIPANAVFLELNNGGPFFDTAFTDEVAVGIKANNTIDLTAMAIFGNLPIASYSANIYESTNGFDVGALVASKTATLGNSGELWYQIGQIAGANLIAGNYYVLGFKALNSTNSIPIKSYELGDPLELGAVTLLEGLNGNPLSGNFLAPNLRIFYVESAPPSSVPVPAAIWLFGSGLIGLIGLARRKFHA